MSKDQDGANQHASKVAGMNEWQSKLLRDIQAMKADPHHDAKALKRLVRMLVRDDDREGELKRAGRMRYGSKGGRNPSFGKWRDE